MFWLSEKIAAVFHSLFGKSGARGLTPEYIAKLESLEFVEGVSKLGNTYAVLTNEISKNGNVICLYLSDDGETLHDGGQVLANTSELVMETQIASNLPQSVKIVDGYLVNESLVGSVDCDHVDMSWMLDLIKAY
jgi:hypothetical protein